MGALLCIDSFLAGRVVTVFGETFSVERLSHIFAWKGTFSAAHNHRTGSCHVACGGLVHRTSRFNHRSDFVYRIWIWGLSVCFVSVEWVLGGNLIRVRHLRFSSWISFAIKLGAFSCRHFCLIIVSLCGYVGMGEWLPCLFRFGDLLLISINLFLVSFKCFGIGLILRRDGW